jgi:hypothetical protein
VGVICLSGCRAHPIFLLLCGGNGEIFCLVQRGWVQCRVRRGVGKREESREESGEEWRKEAPRAVRSIRLMVAAMCPAYHGNTSCLQGQRKKTVSFVSSRVVADLFTPPLALNPLSYFTLHLAKCRHQPPLQWPQRPRPHNPQAPIWVIPRSTSTHCATWLARSSSMSSTRYFLRHAFARPLRTIAK